MWPTFRNIVGIHEEFPKSTETLWIQVLLIYLILVNKKDATTLHGSYCFCGQTHWGRRELSDSTCTLFSFFKYSLFKFMEKPTICVSLSGINNWIIDNRAFVAASILLSIFSEVSRHWTQDVTKSWLLANFTV